jgi:hypothetical protein
MYVTVRIKTLKELYKTIRELREWNERYLRIIDRMQSEAVGEEEIFCSGGLDAFSNFFNIY